MKALEFCGFGCFRQSFQENRPSQRNHSSFFVLVTEQMEVFAWVVYFQVSRQSTFRVAVAFLLGPVEAFPLGAVGLRFRYVYRGCLESSSVDAFSQI